MSETPFVYLVAAERSGDLLGAGLADHLRELTGGEIRMAGIGGRAMAEAGLPSQIDTSGLSILGWFEGLKAYGRVKEAVAAAVDAIVSAGPDAVVLIDSWGFTLRVAQGVREADPSIRLIKYVGPQVFATRPGRARTLSETVDHLLTILTLDAPFYEPFGLPVTFVGNPTLERIPKGDGEGFRARHGIEPGTDALAVLFGSRVSEIERLFPIFADAVGRLRAGRDNLRLIVPIADSVDEMVRQRIVADPRFEGAVLVDESEKPDAFDAADAALACSGTVIQELASAGVPSVTGYRLGWMSWALLRGLKLYKPRYISLVNIHADEELVREFVQTRCTGRNLAAAVGALLDDPQERAALSQRLRDMIAEMRGDGQASRRAAQAVLAALD